MYSPTLEEVKKLKKQGNLVPVYREIKADLETPVSAYLKIAHGNYSFLLESVEGGERLARYSFLGTEPAMVLTTNNGTTSNIPLPRRERQGEGEISPSPVRFAQDRLNLPLPSPERLRAGRRQGREAHRGDPLLLVEKEFKRYRMVPIEGLPRFHGGMVGYLSYEVARYFEELPTLVYDPIGLPESKLMLADTLLIFDHLTHKIKVVSHARLDGDIEKSYGEATQKIDRLVERLDKPVPVQEPAPAAAESEISSNLTQAQYEAIVTRMKKYIYDGDIIQGVPSLRLARPTRASPFSIYRALRSINPSPYMYFLHMDDFHIVGASPELLVRVEDGIVSNHPIAGTRPRGKDNKADKALEKELKTDEKERAEHLMLVDLARNDVGRISEPGSVEVTQFMDVERYSHVMHLVSHVQGKLRKGLTQFDALRACFPAGTVSGAPKIRAMEIIAELEREKRGPYAGAVGYFDFSGNIDTAIAIRTIIIKDGVAYVQAGAGIVADSVPAKEYQECLNKMQAMLTAINQAEAS
ncbi:MAG: anthranilate synthase component I [Chloroflexi bacterium]|nr:anthranilate synthase component I [Chloroflexota bacterium]